MTKFKVLETIRSSFRIVWQEPSIIGIFLIPVLLAAAVFFIPSSILGLWSILALKDVTDFMSLLLYLPTILLTFSIILILGLIAVWIAMTGIGGLILKVEAKMRRRKMEFCEALRKGFKNSGRMFVAYLAEEGITTLGYIFFIIPGIYLAMRLALVLPACILGKKGFGVKRSWQATRGNFWRILLLVAIWAAMFLITSFIPFLIVTWILLFPAYLTALTLVYMKLRR